MRSIVLIAKKQILETFIVKKKWIYGESINIKSEDIYKRRKLMANTKQIH
ncbi:hypothetical protein ACVPOR_10785 [Staphylococcus aureus]